VTPLAARLLDEIRQEGPITIARFMQACLFDPHHGYYATGPLIGGAGEGDFLTAPETSQMFGELLGLWCVHEWTTMGKPDPFVLIELGPGRGALIADAWRAAKVAPGFHDAAQLRLIDPSRPLRRLQAESLAKVGAEGVWLDSIEEAPQGPMLLLANEVLDCLPIRQFVTTPEGWRERLVGEASHGLGFGLSHPLPIAKPETAPDGYWREVAEGAETFLRPLLARLIQSPGRALFLDYGYEDPNGADTLQAVRRHQKLHPLEAPGQSDLTAQVDFAAIAARAADVGVQSYGPLRQGVFLKSLGIAERAAALAQRNPDRQERLDRELNRLVAPDQMGDLFKALCLSSPLLPPPAGFPACSL
jgi:NADH dehydrogenase [ubiquinone] 1 alpha subcomplex assembly factor 7